MAHIRRRAGKFFVEIRKKYGQKIYATFDRLSDARSFAKETELQIQQNRYRDISEFSFLPHGTIFSCIPPPISDSLLI